MSNKANKPMRVILPASADETSPPRAPETSIEGVGIHSGKPFRVSFFVASRRAADIRFYFQLQDRVYWAPASWTRLSGTSRATALVLRGDDRRRFELKTIEHLMAALCVLGLWNMDIHIEPLYDFDENRDAVELPILDGSALPWMKLLKVLNPTQERLHLPRWRCMRVYEVRDGERMVMVAPHEQNMLSFLCEANFAGGKWVQSAQFDLDYQDIVTSRKYFEQSLAGARTFGFEDEIERLRERGLIRGGSMDNAILLREDQVLNPGGLRLANELAAHKLMDAVGDFALLGAPLVAKVLLHRAGHEMHLRAVEEGVKTGALLLEA